MQAWKAVFRQMAFLFGSLLGVGVIHGEPAAASPVAASEWIRTGIADIRLISAAAATGDRVSVPLGLQFRLDKGWKIYWRTPGDAGFPPALDVSGSDNLKQIIWNWPAPERFSLFGLENYGYKGDVVLPITATLEQAGHPLAIRAAVNALACNDICVPLEGRLVLALPSGPPGPTAFTQLIDRFRARVPGAPERAGLTATQIDAIGSPQPHSVSVTLISEQPMTAPDVFIETEPGFSFGAPVLVMSEAGRRAVLTVPASVPDGRRLAGLNVTLTVVDGDRFFESPAAIGPQAPGNDHTASAELWMTMLGFALLGGLILNLMPCVLPVLSLKLVHVLRHGGGTRRAIRHGFLASVAGIIISFLALAGGAIALKAAGQSVGWGIQFQQPLFLTAMTVILGAFAANLFGWFEIPVPALASRLARTTATRDTGDTGLVGHALSGAFATLLATPCSAPFLGTAIGFALARGPGEILAIFLIMGIGFALPYLLVAALPGLVHVLPRPGRWMSHLQIALGLALLATAVWLLSVIAAQVSTAWLVAITLLLAIAGLLLFVSKRRGSLALSLTAGVVAILVLILGGMARDQADRADQDGPGDLRQAAGDDSTRSVEWIEFSAEHIAALVRDGHVVLVDVTADWCLTCKVNKTLVLERDAVRARMASGDLVGMRADWTRPNPRIASYLADFGRYGIPFNAVFGPARPAGIVLPELLDAAAVLDALEKAAGPG